MKPKYITQVLVKQVKIDPYSAKYIVDLLIQAETNKWKTIFNNILYDLIKHPQIKSVHNKSKLSYMYHYHSFNLLNAIQLGNTIQQIKKNYKQNPKFTIDHIYYDFHRKIKQKITKQQDDYILKQCKNG